MKEYEARQFKVCYMNSPEKAQVLLLQDTSQESYSIEGGCDKQLY